MLGQVKKKGTPCVMVDGMQGRRRSINEFKNRIETCIASYDESTIVSSFWCTLFLPSSCVLWSSYIFGSCYSAPARVYAGLTSPSSFSLSLLFTRNFSPVPSAWFFSYKVYFLHLLPYFLPFLSPR